MSDAEIMSDGAQTPASESIVESKPTRTVKGRHGGDLTPFTSETARRAVEHRWELARRGTMRAIRDLTGASNTEQAAYEMAKPMVEQLKEGGKGIAPIYLALHRTSGMLADRRDAPNQSAGVVVSLSMPAEAASQMLDGLARLAGKDKD